MTDVDLDRDGVVVLRGALTAEELGRIEDVYEYGRAHPSPGAYTVYPETGATFYIDTFNAANWDAYLPAYRDTAVPDHVQRLWGSEDVWFFYEQLFLKEGGSMRRTPWHQDSSYLPVAGSHVAVCWISLDTLDAEESLEFVRGSHRGPMFNTSAFDAQDDTKPILDDLDLPRLPDIESARDDYDIVSWAIEPGDMVVFHANVLHGGAPTTPGRRRRTVSLRYFGDDAVYAPRRRIATDPEGKRVATELASAFGDMRAGEPFRSGLFRKVR
ncbi:MAG TPA: phytanoyl-CoA dioxygenase family protein [Acidimicrobiales bacterium]|nr:phytanoyl-CoA dioxygenase family protein [Acidimicrobiales bacterium]